MPQKILLVDDDLPLLRAIERNIGDDFDLTLANSACEAISCLENQGPFSVLVSDVKMPGIDGIQLVGKVNERWPEVKSIILTGNQECETLHRARRVNAFRFLCKPSPHRQIAAAIDDALLANQPDSATDVNPSNQVE